MKAMKLAGLVLVLLAPMAMATDGSVFWNVRVTTNSSGLTLVTNVASSTISLYITTSVAVTGDNQGLAGMVAQVGVNDLTAGGSIVTWPIPTAQSSFKACYQAPGATGLFGTYADPATIGGMGLSNLASSGTLATDRTFVSQIGGGVLDWKARTAVADTDPDTGEPTGTFTWIGANQWGMGMASRASALLKPGSTLNSAFDVTTIRLTLNNANWVKGHSYQVVAQLVSASVLNSGVDLNMDQPGGITTAITGAGLVNSIANFYIVPEPTTMLLLAAGALVLRRRRHA